jgi:hypothetical protein
MNRVGAVTRREEDSLLALLRYIGERSRRWSLSPAPAGLHPHPSAELLLLTGPSFILDVGTTLAGWMTLRGRTVLYVDGANAFDPYILSALAREAGQPPKAVLQRLHLSRAFTCHQLETLIADRLPGAIAHFRPGLVVISGWSHLFHDENVPEREAFRLFQNTAGRIHALAEAGQSILATHPLEPVTPRLRPLGETLARAADGVVRLREEEGLILAVREKPSDPHGARPLVLPQEDCRLWLRGRHRQELADAYPWSGR